MSSFTILPITRQASRRAHPDISAGFSVHGDLSLILSPEFLAGQERLAIGARIIVGYDETTGRLLIAPAEEGQTEATRRIRKREGFEGAGGVVVASVQLPASFPRFEKRRTVFWTQAEDGAGVIVEFNPGFTFDSGDADAE